MSNNNVVIPSLDQMYPKNRLNNNSYTYKEYIKTSIQENYLMPCINKCFTDYESPLTGLEKACLAKCIDRAADFHVIAQSEMNPYNTFNQKYILNSADGISLKTN